MIIIVEFNLYTADRLNACYVYAARFETMHVF